MGDTNIKYAVFTLVTGTKVAIFFNGNLTVTESMSEGKTIIRVLDGLHNNGGWEVQGTFTEALNKIIEA